MIDVKVKFQRDERDNKDVLNTWSLAFDRTTMLNTPEEIFNCSNYIIPSPRLFLLHCPH